MIARRLILGAFLAIVAYAPTRAAVLLNEYTLRDTMTPVGGGPALEGIGGSITALGYVFAAHPFSLGTTAALPASVTVEFSFTFRVSGELSAGNFSANPVPAKYDIAAPLVRHGATGGMPEPVRDVPLTFVLTRDAATNVVSGYVNGEREFVLSHDVPDTAGPLTASFAFSLTSSTGSLVSPFLAGRVESVRIIDGALTASDVGRLYASELPLPIPEPSTYVLLGVGVIALYFNRRGRKTRKTHE